MTAFFSRFRRDTAGAAMIESALVLPMILVLTGGTIEFLYSFWQYNMAVKAAERGARIAAVSNPVAPMLSTTIINSGDPNKPPGTAYSSAGLYGPIVCSSTNDLTVTCRNKTQVVAADATAFQQIYYGRASVSCSDAQEPYYLGMCDIGPEIQPSHVQVIYEHSGLGFYGEPRLSPTVRVQVSGIGSFVGFLGLAGLASWLMPEISASVTGEDLSSAGS